MTAKQHVRTTVEPDVFAELQYRADEAGVSLFVYLRTVLTDHAAVVHTVTAAQWRAVSVWVRADPRRIAGYTGPTDYKTSADSRTTFYRWALAHGYTPEPG